ncbi:MAG: hypothetical protein JRH20_13365 [Deltaproteobacteria bacterium]|nr:hypothetical protein [Deltaproteobacteria bacterium]
MTQMCEQGQCVAFVGQWSVWLVKGQVDSTTSSGEAWDLYNPFAGEAPDPYVAIGILGETFIDGTSETVDDTTSPLWNENLGDYTAAEFVQGILFNVRDTDGGGLFNLMGRCTLRGVVQAGTWMLMRSTGDCVGAVEFLEIRLVER